MPTVLHVDMDAFFASVEQLHHPEWRGKPLVVGSPPHERGVVSTCSYEARRYGIHSAMPSRTAYQLCPHAIFKLPDSALYESVSEEAFAVFRRYSPSVEAVSIDEAFLDISGTHHLYGGPRELGEALRADIRRTCGVTCSVGIGSNRLLAKIGSEENKPDGLTVMPSTPAEIAAFLAPKPLRTLWGVGPKTGDALRPYGIATCGDIQRIPLEELETLLGSASAARVLKEYSYGIAPAEVASEAAPEKTVSRENTFGKDEEDRSAVRRELLKLVSEVGLRFRTEQRWALTARIKLRDAGFGTITRQTPFDAPARDDMTFREKALALFDAAWPPHEKKRLGRHAIRLIGFGVANIRQTPATDRQQSLFSDAGDTERRKREKLAEALDALHARGIRMNV